MTANDFDGFWADEAALLLDAAPDLIVRARTHLVDMALTDPDLSSAKAVKEHYAACKQIQAYYEGILKMLRSVSAEQATVGGSVDMGRVLSEIDAELNALPSYDDDPDADPGADEQDGTDR